MGEGRDTGTLFGEGSGTGDRCGEGLGDGECAGSPVAVCLGEFDCGRAAVDVFGEKERGRAVVPVFGEAEVLALGDAEAGGGGGILTAFIILKQASVGHCNLHTRLTALS